MDYSILEYLWFFIIYAFLGWCVEVAFHAVTSGKFVNRGFLNGPVTPIYGFGMSILIFSLGSLVDNFILLFIGSFFLTSILEFITGFTLEKLFHTKWWDYNDMPFNIKGYVSLSFSIVWGLGGVFMLNIIHPSVSRFISYFDNTIGNVFLIIFLLYFLADFLVTVFAIIGINRHLNLLEDMADRMKVYSDDIGENIYKGMTAAVKTKNNIQDRIEESKAESKAEKIDIEISKLQEEYAKLKSKKSYVHRHLERSYPKIKERISQLRDEIK